jgi:glycosyltransferase involved in cell wall biosynthesis
MPNGVDAQAFISDKPKSEIQKELGLSDKLVILFVGRLMSVKSLPTFVDALANALPTCPNLHLLLVGEGPAQASLEKQARELGVEAHITFVGQQRDIKPYLGAADIFVLPSKSEGISNALLEAMSAGLACVSTSVGGGYDVLDGGKCGLLVKPGDVPAWTHAIVDLATDPARRKQLGEAARQRILDHYDFSVVGSKYEALYTELLNAGNKPTRDA